MGSASDCEGAWEFLGCGFHSGGARVLCSDAEGAKYLKVSH